MNTEEMIAKTTRLIFNTEHGKDLYGLGIGRVPSVPHMVQVKIEWRDDNGALRSGDFVVSEKALTEIGRIGAESLRDGLIREVRRGINHAMGKRGMIN